MTGGQFGQNQGTKPFNKGWEAEGAEKDHKIMPHCHVTTPRLKRNFPNQGPTPSLSHSLPPPPPRTGRPPTPSRAPRHRHRNRRPSDPPRLAPPPSARPPFRPRPNDGIHPELNLTLSRLDLGPISTPSCYCMAPTLVGVSC